MPLNPFRSRSALRWLPGAIAGLFLIAAGAQAEPVTVTDALGRSVSVNAPVQRIVLAQARHYPLLALLHPHPAKLVAGWSDELRTSYVDDYAAYLKDAPELADIPVVARHTPDTFSVEKALSLKPDLVVLTPRFAGGTSKAQVEDTPIMKRFAAADVPVIVVDFFIRPMEHTVPSLRALGAALGEDARTGDFIAFYEQHMHAIRERLVDVPAADRPNVFMHAHAGTTDCCNSPGTGTFEDMIEYAGGHNIGSDSLKTATGRLSFEFVNASRPAVYIATGTGAGQRSQTGLAIGRDVPETEARASLQRIIARDRLGGLPAVRSGNAHGIWHGFNDSPLHVVFIEALAGWIHPERMQGISAQATLDEINRRFLGAVPMTGTYMVDLEPQAPDS